MMEKTPKPEPPTKEERDAFIKEYLDQKWIEIFERKRQREAEEVARQRESG